MFGIIVSNMINPVQPCNAKHDGKKTIANFKYFYLGASVSLHFTSFMLHWLSSSLRITMCGFSWVLESPRWRRMEREKKNERGVEE